MTTQAFRPSPGFFQQFVSRWRNRNASDPQPGHREFQDGQCGVSYNRLFGPYLAGATKIVITDRFIQQFYQARNLMEFLETVIRHKVGDRDIVVHLITSRSEAQYEGNQLDYLARIQDCASMQGIVFSWEFAERIHDRTIIIDNRWKIVLGRGLDIFQWYDVNNAFDFQNRLQITRKVRGFNVIYIRLSPDSAPAHQG